MEAGNEYRLSENVTVHGINHCCTSVGRLLRSALGHFEFRVECVQLERVVVINRTPSSRAHVSVGPEADLTAAIGQLALRNPLRQARGRSRNVPDQPVRDVHLCTLILERFGVVHEQNEALSSHGNLTPFEFRRGARGSAFLCVLVGNDPAIFPCTRRHDERRCLLPASATLTAAASALSALALSDSGG